MNFSSQIGGAFVLALVTALWGSSFVVIKQILPDIEAAPINLARFTIAAIALAPFIHFRRQTWRYGLEMGLWLFAGFSTQTIGLHYTTVNRSAFITAMQVILVPLLSSLFGHPVRTIVWAAAVTSIVGCGLLCNDGGGPNVGDLWSVGSALAWAMYIFRLGSVAPRCSPLPLAITQLVPVVVLCGIWNTAPRTTITNFHWPSLIYLGLAGTAVPTWLQAAAQRVVPAPQAAVIFMLEPVFAAILGFIVLGERLALRGVVGALLIILAAVFSQLTGTGEKCREIAVQQEVGC